MEDQRQSLYPETGSRSVLRNYLLLTLRNLSRNRLYSFINIFGLAVGLGCCLLLLGYVQDEWSFDTFHEDSNAILRVQIDTITLEKESVTKAGQPFPLAAAMASEFPEVVSATGLSLEVVSIRAVGNEAFEETIFFTDPGFFSVFSFETRGADRMDLLKAPDELVLTEVMAQKYFGESDPVGRTLEVSFGGPYQEFTVSAVSEDPPANSSIKYDFLLPVQSDPDFDLLESWWSAWSKNTYVRLHDASQRTAVEARLDEFRDRHYANMMRTFEILKWISEDEGAFRLSLLPLADVHFAHTVQQVKNETADPAYPYILTLLAFGILILACINFTTLAIGRATQRVREVGLRKVLGAGRRQLIRQFQGEAFLFSILALVLGLGIAEAASPLFSDLLGREITLDYLSSPIGVILLAGLLLLTGLLAGFYPSIYLSRFVPIDILRNSVGGGRSRWMKGLVILQFGLTAFFFFSILVISGQLRFIEEADLGFETDQILVVPVSNDDAEQSNLMLDRFRQTAGGLNRIAGIAAASSGFDRSLAWNSFSTPDGAHLNFTNRVSSDFIEVMGIQVIAGRGFSDEYPGDATNAVVVNEALVNDYGWENPVGKRLSGFSCCEGDGGPVVIGVVEDYNFKSLHHAVEPIALFMAPRDPYKYLFIQLTPGSAYEAIESVRNAWQDIAPDKPFSAFFLDDDLDQKYATERMWQQMIRYGTLLAVLIACLGLFGLASFTAEQRTKELGIRKVLGASVPGLATLLSGEFVKLIIVAQLVTLPVAYLVMNRWLDRFAYRFEPGATEFLIAAGAVLGIALATVSYQAFRAATADPVKSLRYE